MGVASRKLETTGRLPYLLYRIILGQVPIACVDVIPVAITSDGLKLGFIRRADEVGDLRWAMIGGGIHRGETIGEALARHIHETLGENAQIALSRDEAYPQAIGQYFPTERPGFGHDPRKHAIAVSYWGVFSGSATAMGEAHEFSWFGLDAVPGPLEFGYGHHLTVSRLVATLEDDKQAFGR